MPRAKSPFRTTFVDNALTTFWKKAGHLVLAKDLIRNPPLSLLTSCPGSDEAR
ncbi:MAG: hypothetical protein ACJARR_002381 [Pseudophaeobacter arcticus]|jgi:hypothetical protein